VDPAAFRQANFFNVTPSYFETMRARLIAGRTFIDADNVQATPDQPGKVVIDDLLAAQAFPHGSPIGRRLLVRNLFGGGPNAPTNVPVEVIGVIAHQRHEGLAAPGREAIFFIDGYNGFGVPRWAVRTSGDPMSVAQAVAAAVQAIDGRVPVAEVQPMQAFVDRANGPTRFATTLIGVFAAIALVLAAIGLYGVLTTTVRQRTAEIGMRMVCGAQPSGILRLVLREGLWLSGAGMLVGAALALSVGGLIRSLLVGVTPTDPITYVFISVVFLAIVVMAALVPAMRASRVDPVVAIREQ
jgi:putative ABC transport system permease protein